MVITPDARAAVNCRMNCHAQIAVGDMRTDNFNTTVFTRSIADIGRTIGHALLFRSLPSSASIDEKDDRRPQNVSLTIRTLGK